MFADLPILTARPGPEEAAELPHRLYGLLGAQEQPSVARWLKLLAPVLAEARCERRPLIVVGGTGLYLLALLLGMPPMPEIPESVRTELRQWAGTVPLAAVHARLAARDPEIASRLRPTDRQRLLRALEVVETTGRSLLAWQAAPRQRLPLPDAVLGIALVPPTATINRRIESRLRAMLEAGAMAEVADLVGRRPDTMALPIAKVHGLRELAAVVAGGIALDAAQWSIAAQIRGYAKRQRTWFRHQLPQLSAVESLGESAAALAFAIGLIENRVADARARAGVDHSGAAD